MSNQPTTGWGDIKGATLIKQSYTNKIGTAGSTQLTYQGTRDDIIYAAEYLYAIGFQTNHYNLGAGGSDCPIWQVDASYQGNINGVAQDANGSITVVQNPATAL